MKCIIGSHEIGLLYKDKKFIKSVNQGIYRSNILFRKKYLVIDKREDLTRYNLDYKLFVDDVNFKEKVIIINVKNYEVAFHFKDGIFCDLLTAGNYAYFNDIIKHEFILHDARNIEISDEVDSSIYNSHSFISQYPNIIRNFLVPEGCEGALFVNCRFIKILQPGKYHFLVIFNDIEVKNINMKVRSINVGGQELLTQDKVNLRVNFVLNLKTIDSNLALTAYENYDEQLYLLCQLALREFVSTQKLDELLERKHELGILILDGIKNKEKQFGVHFLEAGIKDIILTGEVKEILNSVLIAEKKALANVITRREETASTRSLLNTAKLLDENKTLYRLKELEYLEKICEKIENISITSSGGILEQLSGMIHKIKEEK